jgi:hypothetical protein
MQPTSLAVTAAAGAASPLALAAPALTLAADTRSVRAREDEGGRAMSKSIRAAVVLLTVLLLPTSAASVHSASADSNGLHYYFATARDTYTIGEVIPIDYVVTNVSQDTMVIDHPCNGPSGSFGYQIWAPGPPADPEPRVIWGCCGCFPAMYRDWSFEPGETYSRHFDRSTDNAPRPGSYTLDGWFGAWRVVGDEYEPVGYEFSLDFQMLEAPTGLAELEGTWSTIKALFR